MDIDDQYKYRKRLWSCLAYPIRPSGWVVDNLLADFNCAGETLILGATLEFVFALSERKCEKVTVVDADPIALRLLTENLTKTEMSVHVVQNYWDQFLKETRHHWPLVLMDCGFFFINRQSIIKHLALISRVMTRDGHFCSRQIVRGRPEECDSCRNAAFSVNIPTSEAFSFIWMTNAIIAADYGKTTVSYRMLQDLAEQTEYEMRNRWGKALPQVHYDCLQAFRSANWRPQGSIRMTEFPSPKELLDYYDRAFGLVTVKSVPGNLSSFYRIIRAGNPLCSN